MHTFFQNRRDAGHKLADALRHHRGRQTAFIVLGLPRGGMPVAAEVARTLGAPLDALVVRKLGMPGHNEYAMGALASGAVLVLDNRLIAAAGVKREAIEAVQVAEQDELLRREQCYRPGRPPLDLSGQEAILVDDGLATGATMQAAVLAARQAGAAFITVAVPVGSVQACARMEELADKVVCLHQPLDFQAVSIWYESFPQTSDEEVASILAHAQ